MKMSPEKYAVLKRDVGKFIQLERAPGRLDETRMRWDALFLAIKEGLSLNWIYEDGLDDDHIDTALRRVVREVRAGK
jgi:hypothetical protein